MYIKKIQKREAIILIMARKRRLSNTKIFILLVFIATIAFCIITSFLCRDSENASLILGLQGLIIVLGFVGALIFNKSLPKYQDTYKLAKTAEIEKEQAELKTSIMLSQIQPHFLYNALNSIKVLCQKDPEQAAYAIEEFADYLRMNMSSLQSKKLVPFSEELQHTKTYLRIEKLRFQDKLNVQYDIRFEDFTIPPLSLQPLVENAVKHGAGQMEEGGTITIKTRKDGKKAIISVEDTGPGFDMNAALNDGRQHVGIENVKTRLNSVQAGELIIESAPGEKTTASIILNLKD